MTLTPAGQLDTALFVQEQTETEGDFGGTEKTWQSVDLVMCKRRGRGGREGLTADQLEQSHTHVLRCRVNPARPITPDHRLLEVLEGRDDVVFEIISADKVERDREYELLVREVKP